MNSARGAAAGRPACRPAGVHRRGDGGRSRAIAPRASSAFAASLSAPWNPCAYLKATRSASKLRMSPGSTENVKRVSVATCRSIATTPGPPATRRPPLRRAACPGTTQSGSSSMPWRRTISAAFSGGSDARRRHGRRLGRHADLLDEVLEAARARGPTSCGAPSGPMVNRCGMSRGPYACWPGPSSTVSSPTWIVTRALEDVEALVLAVVDVQRGLQARGAVISTGCTGRRCRRRTP